jgi:hypothetical protein
MTRLARLSAVGLLLVVTGCRTCDDRPRPFSRLRDAFDREDDRPRSARDTTPRMTDPCAPCAGGTGYGQPLGSPMTWGGGPVAGVPVVVGPTYPGGAGTVVPGGTYSPRDGELPLPGEYAQPRSSDFGRTAPKPPNTFTGK